jgi:glycosyltransferase involved in cell wall biosynthesis
MSLKKVSVVVPIYNSELYLRECLDSVLKQDFEYYEVILVDNGSDDTSNNICKTYCKKDPRFTLIEVVDNVGCAEGRNIGLRKACGEYVIFMDSDDIWISNDFLSNIYNKINQSSDDIVFFGFQRFYENGQWGKTTTVFDLSKFDGTCSESINYLITSDKLLVAPWSKIIRRKFLHDNHIYFEPGILAEDVDWTLFLLSKAHNIGAINYPMYGYRVRYSGGGSTGKRSVSQKLSSSELSKICDYRIDLIHKWCKRVNSDEFDKNLKPLFLSYLLFQYYILLGDIGNLTGNTYSKYIAKVQEFSLLKQYILNRRARILSRFENMLGTKFVSFLMYIYIKYLARLRKR